MRSQQSRWRLPVDAILALLICSTGAAGQGLISPLIQDGLINPAESSCSAARDGYTYSTFPWTHNPTCFDTAKKERFCTYTNSNYNNARGISFVVSPEVAASFILETFDRGLGGLDGQVGQEMGMWHVKETEEKGRGVFARSDVAGIFAGESIILKTPVLFVAKNALESEASAQKIHVLDVAIEQLPEKTRDSVKSLSKAWAEPTSQDIVKTNNLEVKWPWVDDVPVLLAVTPEVALINHACRPNAFWRFNDDTLAFEVVAVKNIKPGEEITLSYGFEKRAHKRRTRSIKDNFGFNCRCALCTANDTEIEASNDRLSEIKALKSVLPTEFEDSPQLLGLLPPLIKNLEEEDLPLELAMYEEILALTWSAFGIKDRAKYWAERAKTHWTIITGKQSWESKRCGDLEADVEGHATWMTWKGDPWEGVGKGHPWDEHEHGHDHDHDHEQGKNGGQKHEEEGEDLSGFDQRPERDQFRGHT